MDIQNTVEKLSNDLAAYKEACNEYRHEIYTLEEKNRNLENRVIYWQALWVVLAIAFAIMITIILP